MAIETGLRGAPTFRSHLPRFLSSEFWNFVPLGLMCLAGMIWIYVALTETRPAPETTASKANATGSITSVAQSTPAPSAQTSTAQESPVTPPSAADWHNWPPSPWAGPIGPILSVEFVQLFDALPKPCKVQITAPPDNHLHETLSWLLNYGGSGHGSAGAKVCDLDNTEVWPPNVDEPKSNRTNKHGGGGDSLGRKVCTWRTNRALV